MILLLMSANIVLASSVFDTQLKSFNIKNATVKEAIKQVLKGSKYTLIYSVPDMEVEQKITLILNNTTEEDALLKIMNDTGLTYSVKDNNIIISKSQSSTQQPQQKITVSGKVVDDAKKPIAGATVLVLGTTVGAITDDKGAFSVTMKANSEIEISFVGMVAVKRKFAASEQNVVIAMKSDAMAVEEVIVTGIYTRSKESFTGSATTYSIKDLKKIGGTNLLQSLRTLDPTFVILDSKQFGSNPNRMPDMQIRGTTSVAGLKTEFEEDPNRPLFVLDGIECRLDDIVNLNMDRVQSITVLKDAASTAIYGSRAANGVVVVETLQPQPGKIRVSYNGNFVLNMPDLSDYNLMTAGEKLEFERVAGLYSFKQNPDDIYNQLILDKRYNERLLEVKRGVDTYWLNEPLRTTLNNTHNITVDGGEGSMRYSMNVNYNGNNGVMKGSSRNVIGASLNLTYRTEKLLFSNQFYTTITKSEEAPLSFSEYSKQNPYYRKADANGNNQKYLYAEYGSNGELYDFVLNPLYVAQIPNTDKATENNFRNTFTVEWRILNELRVRGRFTVNSITERKVKFKSPSHPDYDTEELLKRGKYESNNSNSFKYNGDVTITYGKLFAEKHLINAVGGWDFNDNSSNKTGFNTIGFVSDLHTNPSFSTGFRDGQKPIYSISNSRSTSFYANANYSFDNRYLVDANIRMDGTSRFGSNNLFSATWAFGAAWNLHNEEFIKKGAPFINNLKLRASIGNPGNQNFDAYIAYKTYIYNADYQNMFGVSAITSSFGNKDLEWQRTLDKNIGFDLSMFDNRLNVSAEYYYKTTDPMLVQIPVPLSTGTRSVFTNLGGQNGQGVTGTVRYMIFRRDNFNWSANYNFRIGNVKYFGIGDKLRKLNEESSKITDIDQDNYQLQNIIDSDILKKYRDGAEVNDLYAVRSLGIDPASGREMFIDENGNQTYKYKETSSVKVGNSTPDIEGVIGSSLYYKGFSFSLNLRYSLGADQMASALYNKVENITSDKLNYNQDKRALYDRWVKPGDDSKFSSLVNVGSSQIIPMSSRFVVEENYLSFESISFGYETTAECLRKVGLQGANITAYFSNIGRITSLKEERGLDYPFARSITLSIGLRF